MKKKFSKIWGVSVLLMLLVTLLVPALPASAGTLSFTSLSLPNDVTNKVVSGARILDIAVKGDTVYVATGATGNMLYKSTDAGATFSSLTLPGAVVSVNLLAVAPDDENLIVLFGGAGNITGYVSTNGGSTWSALGTVQSGGAVAATALYDIAVAPVSAGIHYIGCAGTAGANAPGLYYYNMGAAVGSWKNACVAAATDFTDNISTSAGADDLAVDSLHAIAFSPNFASDKVALGVSFESANASAVKLQIASFANYQWNTVAGFSGYPVAIEAGAATAINSADIAMAPDYLGSDDTLRLAFVGTSITVGGVEAGGIYRFKDTSKKDMKDATAVNSVAYDGTNLVAGAYDSNIAYYCSDPLASSPTVSSSRSYKRVGQTAGTAATVVKWMGTSVAAGTNAAGTAFSISQDNGRSFNGVALADENWGTLTIEDIWVSPDGAKTYVLVSDGTNTAVWRSASAWERIFQVSGTLGYIIRGAPDNNDVLYVADTGATTMFYTSDAGQEKWTVRAASSNIGDLALESADVAYASTSGSNTVRKTTNSGFTWGTAKDSRIGGAINTIVCLGENQVVVGGNTNRVGYSTDGNSSWVQISSTLGVAGAVQVTATGLNDGDYIYATTAGASSNIYSWQIGTSSSWSNKQSLTAGYMGYGLAIQDGTLYCLASDGTNSELQRTLNPVSSAPTFSTAMTQTADTYNTAPSALRTYAGSNKLLMIDTTAPDVITFTDTIATVGPEPITPADGYRGMVNNITGRAQDISFSWSRPSDKSGFTEIYQLRIYEDAAGTYQLTSVTVTNGLSTVVQMVGPYQAAGTAQAVEFAPGKTYYWRVRVATNGPVYSPYSPMRSFTIEPGSALVPISASPENGKQDASRRPSFSWNPVSGAAKYSFELSTDTAFSEPLVKATVDTTAYAVTFDLNYGQTYYWRVKSVEPVDGEWSAVNNFAVMDKPVEAAPPVVIEQVPPPVINIPAPPPAQEIVIPAAPPPPAPIAPAYIWAIIIIGAVLIIALMVLIVRTRRAV